MTDEEITRRLAEIEGHKPDGGLYSENFGLWCSGGNPYFGVEGRGEVWPFNPLMFDQQCMALIKKYRLSIDSREPVNDEWRVLTMGLFEIDTPYGKGRRGVEAGHKSFNHAVCLAIVEAHNAPD